jgi:hypothetical protein
LAAGKSSYSTVKDKLINLSLILGEASTEEEAERKIKSRLGQEFIGIPQSSVKIEETDDWNDDRTGDCNVTVYGTRDSDVRFSGNKRTNPTEIQKLNNASAM